MPKEPLKISEVICVNCGDRWIAVRPYSVMLRDIACPHCGKGYVIETGETIKDAEDDDE